TLQGVLKRQRADGEAQLKKSEAPHDSVRASHFADMAYQGQIHALRVPIEADWSAERLTRAFIDAYRRDFGNTLDDMPVVVVNVRTTVLGVRGAHAKKVQAQLTNATPKPFKRRPVYFGGWTDAAIYRRADLLPGMQFAGPAIVEQDDATTVVEPGMTTRVDAAGNLLVSLTESEK
ncbi:MAG: hypothetical protein ACKVQU_29375, partial [Burkholderiales bacterium]